MRTSNLIKLVGIGLALLLIPRRSSRAPIIKPIDNPQSKPKQNNEKQTDCNKD